MPNIVVEPRKQKYTQEDLDALQASVHEWCRRRYRLRDHIGQRVLKETPDFQFEIGRIDCSGERGKGMFLRCGGDHCPLCKSVRERFGDTINSCNGCVIYKETGESHCEKTPYRKVMLNFRSRVNVLGVVDDALIEAHDREIEFLTGLIPIVKANMEDKKRSEEQIAQLLNARRIAQLDIGRLLSIRSTLACFQVAEHSEITAAVSKQYNKLESDAQSYRDKLCELYKELENQKIRVTTDQSTIDLLNDKVQTILDLVTKK